MLCRLGISPCGEVKTLGEIRVAVVDDDRGIVRILEEILKGDQAISLTGTGYNGKEALHIIRDKDPDVMLMDLIMPGMDGIQVMETVCKELPPERRPAFIIISAVGQGSIAEDAFDLGASYYLMKPFDNDIILRRVRQAYHSRTRSRSGNLLKEKERIVHDGVLEDQVTRLIHELGVPAHIKGHQYLRNAIVIVVKCPETINSITKVLYPEIARMNHTTPSRVERSIRHAIETAWDRGRSDVFYEIFGNTIRQNKGKPTNSEFIALIADNLRLKYKIHR